MATMERGIRLHQQHQVGKQAVSRELSVGRFLDASVSDRHRQVATYSVYIGSGHEW